MPDEKTLLLHLGYPKSGTTTLQAGLFQDAPGILFLGKSIRDGKERISPEVESFRALVNYGTASHIRARSEDVIAPLKAVWAESGEATALLSLEGLTNPFVDTHYLQPKDIIRKASEIGEILTPLRAEGVRVKLLATVRKQSQLLPSLFSQIYLQAFSTGLFAPGYDAFLDFLFEDRLMGFGPDFMFDAYLDHLGGIFGPENIFATSMKDLLAGAPCRDTRVMADFLGLDEDQTITLMSGRRENVREAGKGMRKMMTNSFAVTEAERRSGLSIRRKAFPTGDLLKIRRGKPVLWPIPDRSDRIDAYYAGSNARLAERYGITF